MTASYMGLLTTLTVPRCFEVTSTNWQSGQRNGRWLSNTVSVFCLESLTPETMWLTTPIRTMMGQPVTSVTQPKYLGVELDSKLTWNEHISAITGKANSSLAFLRRNLYNCPKQIKTQTYYSLVRLYLEYACLVWDPHTRKNLVSWESPAQSCSFC